MPQVRFAAEIPAIQDAGEAAVEVEGAIARPVLHRTVLLEVVAVLLEVVVADQAVAATGKRAGPPGIKGATQVPATGSWAERHHPKCSSLRVVEPCMVLPQLVWAGHHVEHASKLISGQNVLQFMVAMAVIRVETEESLVQAGRPS